MAAWREQSATHAGAVSRKLGRWGGAARCVYCGRRCAPFLRACYVHRDLVPNDPLFHIPTVDDGDNAP